MIDKIAITPFYKGFRGVKRGPAYLLDSALEAGADGVDLFPFRFWSVEDIQSLPPHQILSFQGPLNDGKVANSFNWSRLKRDHGLSPIVDLCTSGIFSRRAKNMILLFDELFPQACATDCTWLERSIPETQPHTLDWQRRDGPIVVDLMHLLEYHNFDSGSALAHLKDIRSQAVTLHFQWRPVDHVEPFLDDFFHSTGYLYDAMKCVTSVDFPQLLVIEVLELHVYQKGYSISDLVKSLRKF